MRLLRYAITPLLVRHTVHLLDRCSGLMCACTASEMRVPCAVTSDMRCLTNSACSTPNMPSRRDGNLAAFDLNNNETGKTRTPRLLLLGRWPL